MSFLQAVGDFFLPQVCLLCGAEGLDRGRFSICETCLGEFHLISRPACPCCGVPYKGAGVSHLCGECRQDPPSFDSAWSLFSYTGKARDLVHHLKFHGNLATLSVIAFLLQEEIDAPALARKVDIIVPVPMHVNGLRQRGYNQALLVAERLAKLLNLPLDRTHLVKTKETPPQIGLTRAQRRRNIQGVFSVVNRDVFRGKAVLIVDDVYTTGATTRACAGVLKKAGAYRIDVLTFARTMPE